MKILIKYGPKKIMAHVIDSGRYAPCILFLSGGNPTLGKERYNEWQHRLKLSDISSVSFDYSDVGSSDALSEKSSLRSRLEEGVCVVDWMRSHMHAKLYLLYGVSMGGYVALGLVSKRPNIFEKLILHAPAAYSLKAHDLTFGKSFTKELRRKNSWKDSFSFEWMEHFNKPILFIEAEKDKTIPYQIIERYKSIKQNTKNFEVLHLRGAPHNLWRDNPRDVKFRDEIFKTLLTFISRRVNQ